jgi:hypothetical protein
MALLHATQLFNGTITTVTPTFTTAYTVATGYRVILRSVAVRNVSTTLSCTVYVQINGVTVFSTVLGTAGSSTGSFEWRPWIVVGPGQTIKLAASMSTGYGVTVSGSIYTI